MWPDRWNGRCRGGTPGGRPVWVYLVFLVYLALVAVVTLGPLVTAVVTGERTGVTAAALIYAVVISASGASLLVIPVGSSWALPDRQRPIWFPLVGSATLAVAVFFGLAVATHEFAFGSQTTPGGAVALRAIWIALPVVWLVWVFVFAMTAGSVDRLRLNGRLYKSLVAGSVLELLVAIPMHLVVRRRAECCAGFATGLGIGVGLIVMVIALGPAIFFLFYRRHQQVYVRRARRGSAS